MALNWTISPALADFSPQMLNYYYRKATTNDCFVSGPSGLGYAMPYDAHNSRYYASASNNKLLVPYTQLTQRYIEKAGLRVITIWDDISTVQRKNYAENCPYLYGLTINDWERQTGRLTGKVQSNWLPVIPQYPCYANGVDVITNFFKRDIKNFTGAAPMFVTGQATVWDAGPDKLVALKQTLDELSPGNVNIVRADHWFSYYNEAHHLPFNITLLEDMEITSSATKTNAKYAADGSPSEGYIWISKDADGTGWVQMDFKEPFTVSRYVLPGFAYPAEFYSPDYSNKTLPKEGTEGADYRRTLYWNPRLQLDENGEAEVMFYNNCRTSVLSAEAEGQTSSGILLWTK